NPLWKYGARDASARRIGPLNFPMSAHLPLIMARPGSVVCTLSPVDSRRSVYSGMSGVRREASVNPVLRGAVTEWSPTFGASWHVVHVPVNDAGSVTPFEKVWPFNPATPLSTIGFVLKIS